MKTRKRQNGTGSVSAKFAGMTMLVAAPGALCGASAAEGRIPFPKEDNGLSLKISATQAVVRRVAVVFCKKQQDKIVYAFDKIVHGHILLSVVNLAAVQEKSGQSSEIRGQLPVADDREKGAMPMRVCEYGSVWVCG